MEEKPQVSVIHEKLKQLLGSDPVQIVESLSKLKLSTLEDLQKLPVPAPKSGLRKKKKVEKRPSQVAKEKVVLSKKEVKTAKLYNRARRSVENLDDLHNNDVPIGATGLNFHLPYPSFSLLSHIFFPCFVADDIKLDPKTGTYEEAVQQGRGFIAAEDNRHRFGMYQIFLLGWNWFILQLWYKDHRDEQLKQGLFSFATLLLCPVSNCAVLFQVAHGGSSVRRFKLAQVRSGITRPSMHTSNSSKSVVGILVLPSSLFLTPLSLRSSPTSSS